ncbi:DUF3180 domain-containing protein [Saccharopolyspora sp. HNM0983]|uniref:DUF3180 domain-containing protein n=1 Tax=Saccharopolyspora montiporae TaxID=2781240 RepID=A0A929B968_9PSEU|nr:DUF3180 domain-containing protein [Saccharopolyspora sp. HNM0983]MBE9374140.1 DUF3180 domain-containing protein [Saccharopolyspora sp. HNM0983]
MTFTQPRHLVTAGLLAAVLVFLLSGRLLYGDLPRLPTLAGATLLVIAAADLGLAVWLRPKVRRKQGVEPPEPVTAARAVALAKASSMGGAIMLGVWLGLLGYVLPVLQIVLAARGDLAAIVVGSVSAAALIAAGLWLEHCLRVPDDRDEPREPHDR